MRVLTSVLPAFGHFYPMVPFLRALADAGHEVTVLTSASFAEPVTRAGLTPLAAGLDWHESRPEDAFPEQRDAFLDPSTRSAMISKVFNSIAPRRMAAAADDIFDATRPDAFVASPIEHGAALIAERRGIPLVTNHGLLPIAGLPGWLPIDAEARASVLAASREIEVMREELGLPPLDRDWIGPSRQRLVFSQCPPSLQPFHAVLSLGPYTHLMRPVSYNDPAPDDPAFHPPGDGRPFIVASLGTVFDRNPELLRAIIDAVGDRATLLIGTTSDLGEVPSNVRLHPWLPMDLVLPRADLFITHGGWGSTIGGLTAGSPMLVIPQGAEQPANALRVSSVGAGVALPPDARTTTHLAEALDRLLGDDLYRRNAQRLADEIAAMPSPAERVELFVRAVEHGPIEAATPVRAIDRRSLPALESDARV